MEREEVTRMAGELASFVSVAELERFASLVAAAERERIAALMDKMLPMDWLSASEAIRALT